MAEVFFYHLTETALEDALPGLLEKTLQKGWRAVVRAGSAERLEALATHLWTYKRDGFLPHGTAKDGFPQAQPVWMTTGDDVPNEAQVLFLTDGVASEDLTRFARVCDLFDGRDDAAVQAARQRWTASKAAGNHNVYWQQSPGGAWTKKSEG